MSEQGELKITIDLIIELKKKDTIYFEINGNSSNYNGTFIGPGGKSEFTQTLNTFFQNNTEFSEFLTIYQANNQANNQAPQPTSTSMVSNFGNLMKPKYAKVSSEQNGGKKTKSNRSYNANKTLKNRK